MNFFVGEDAASQPGPGTCSALKNFVGKSAKKKTVGCSISCVYMDVKLRASSCTRVLWWRRGPGPVTVGDKVP